MGRLEEAQTYEEVAALSADDAKHDAGIPEGCWGCPVVERACAEAAGDAQEAWSYDQMADADAARPVSVSGTNWEDYNRAAAAHKRAKARAILARTLKLTAQCAELDSESEEGGQCERPGVGLTACRVIAQLPPRERARFAYDVVHGPVQKQR